ncbi:TetR family transcriptional regulator [Mycobacterium sp. Root135]|uniref:TetR/AcrR family transcriptional regulator n=1 Tax=Mycobacterium sp. Root135 TaxID=1736457 RepID=UPI0006F442C3|nr:TetR/AcrR family transcriptional regulator [Mycobacterium sp. Root135]KQY01301.1 TetR family transcriptional regulator [Mycobacterium sp. Root135]
MSSKPGRAGKGAAAVAGDRRAPSKGERQRQVILTTLAELLEARPVGELTVNEIASAAGVLRSGYYFYFDSKFAPLAVLAADIWSEFEERAMSFVRFDTETVEQYLDRVQAATAEEWRTHSAVLIASVQAIPEDEQLAAMWRARNQHLADVLTAQVLKDREQGLASPASPDVPGLVAALLEMTMHMLYQDRLAKCPPEQTGRSMSAVRAIWLASVWGRSPATMKS